MIEYKKKMSNYVPKDSGSSSPKKRHKSGAKVSTTSSSKNAISKEFIETSDSSDSQGENKQEKDDGNSTSSLSD